MVPKFQLASLGHIELSLFTTSYVLVIKSSNFDTTKATLFKEYGAYR